MSQIQASQLHESSSYGQVRLQYQEDDVVLVELGGPEEKVIAWTMERLESLDQAIEEIRQKHPKGVVFTGPRADMFCVGVDINIYRTLPNKGSTEEFVRGVQALFDRLSALPCPTVAAISGPCLSAGCELALACKYRLCSDHKATNIGFPEVKLGLIPGYGGTQRLPRLIGVRPAIKMIVEGQALTAMEAVSLGLVHEALPYHKLKERAASIIREELQLKSNRLGLKERFFTFSGLGHRILRNGMKPLFSTFKMGASPAGSAALEAIFTGLNAGTEAGLKQEASMIAGLLATPQCRALMHLCFAADGAKALGKSAKKSVEHIHAVVVGGGIMGSAITCLLAKGECSVVMKDTSEEVLTKSSNTIRTLLGAFTTLPETERSFILNRIGTTTFDTANISNANLAIEAVPEDLVLKQSVLGEISKVIAHDAVLATNTSSLPVSEIASKIDHPARLVGMHFFQPALSVPLVEIVHARRSSDKTLAIAASLAVKLGKYPIIVDDVPGFLVNRLLGAYMVEALILLDQGCPVAAMDKAALEFGFMLGPLRMLDEIGLDVALTILTSLKRAYGERMSGPEYVSILVQQGYLGKKSAAGFYTYGEGEPEPAGHLERLLGIAQDNPPATGALVDRLVYRLINEAVRCLDEGVAGKAGIEAANQIDLGSAMGFGFPSFRGGIIYHAESIGAGPVLEKLTILERECGPRFSPWRGILARAGTGKSFYQPI